MVADIMSTCRSLRKSSLNMATSRQISTTNNKRRWSVKNRNKKSSMISNTNNRELRGLTNTSIRDLGTHEAINRNTMIEVKRVREKDTLNRGETNAKSIKIRRRTRSILNN
jgi:hypothetical protein